MCIPEWLRLGGWLSEAILCTIIHKIKLPSNWLIRWNRSWCGGAGIVHTHLNDQCHNIYAIDHTFKMYNVPMHAEVLYIMDLSCIPHTLGSKLHKYHHTIQ